MTLTDALQQLFADSSPRACIANRRPHQKGSSRTLSRSLAPDDFAAHVAGRARFGAVPFVGDGYDQARWACVDLDVNKPSREMCAGDALERVRALVAELQQRGLVGHVEASKSRGYHVWLFFDERVATSQLRAVILSAIAEVDEGWAQEADAVTPRGTSAAAGNGVWLPLCGADQPPKTRWIDLDTGEPYPDQLSRILRIHERGRSPAASITSYDGPVERAFNRKPELAASVKMLRVLRQLRDAGVLGGLRFYGRGGDRLRVQCPFHHSGRARPDDAVLFSNGNFFCSSCGAKHVGVASLIAALTPGR